MQNLILFLAISLLSVATNAGTIEMKVNGLVCGFCAQGIEKTLRENPTTADVFVSLEHRLVAIATKEGQDIPDDELRNALTASGYDVKAIERTTTPLEILRARLEAPAK